MSGLAIVAAAASWIGGCAAVLAAALVLGMAPQPLLAQAKDVPVRWRAGLDLGLFVAACGLIVYATAAPHAIVEAAALGTVAACLAATLVVDARFLLIPNLYPAVLAVLALVGPLASPPAQALGGAAVGGGLLWAVRALHFRLRGVEGLGLGDVKLMAAAGALCGPVAVLWIIALAALGGIGWSLMRRQAGVAPPAPLGAAAALPALAVIAALKLSR